ncbi:carcinoembryonic antigen-related cell adhesion molecule 19-like [Hyla sarda]|uniref:carcinoembryonic antigen-related cell adhesion molecule 19-like n=1 Tax=Hyla sarda TaxID=327740 RepID=UPI0024C42220|nr:carcinoembryonic antigen-related cell adhesion molecule 19-like [Hyla sarda]XP_056399462.1 carcinoembryonic antigen-related cell adhesion molecule 19-like [Hyla sarda]XP_056399464.1 carcinoembryonic antigen-related cell adhesion molecule 19-like [Hyla sarda]XP_056399465.1 carcinoembryonic antigen-related cell adhesion molecule 19-like [Hyla sarda]
MSGSDFKVFRGFILSAFLAILYACVSASNKLNIEVIPSKPKTGDTLTLNVLGVEGKILFASWYKGQSTSAQEQILTYINGKDIPGSKYFEGANCSTNGSLVIKNFKELFKGEYTVQIQTDKALQDGQVAVDGVASAVFSPFTVLLGLLLSASFL